MIKAQRITIDGNKPYENVEIYTVFDQSNLDVPEYFEDSQICFRCKDGDFIVSVFQVTSILLTKATTKLPDKYSKKYKRLTLSGELVVSPVWVLDPLKSEEIGIPLIFRPYEQFVFACDEGLYITADYSIIHIEI